MGSRFFLLNFLFMALFGFMGFTMYQLQVEQSDYYISKVQARFEIQEKTAMRRGQIFITDKNNKPISIAQNRDFPTIYAVPREIENINYTASRLSELTNQETSELVLALDNPESLFRLIAHKATPEQINGIADLKGIYKGTEKHRFYPYGRLASHLIGFVGVNESVDEPTGLYGLEMYYDESLAEGEDVYLTIDRNLQAASENTLEDLITIFNASGGTIIIQEPKTGAILAMANYPNFDSNFYGQSPVSAFDNPAVQYVYESGSVFKTITMAVGLDSGAFKPDTKFIDTGSVSLNGFTIKNWDGGAYGEVTMTRVLERSINTGAVYAGKLIGRSVFLDYLKKFGFGDYSGIDFPNEVRGSLDNLTREHVREIDFATASFGQGTAVTPTQLINAYSVIANGGLLMKPFINAKEKPYIIRRVIDSEAAEGAQKMMESAVEKAFVAAIPEYRVAGKTGTAQIPDFKKGGYSGEYVHTFVGFLPVSDPRFTLLIKLDKPSAELAGFTVVPAFKELSQFIINYYNIPPDNLLSD